jgi:hypothetical protein
MDKCARCDGFAELLNISSPSEYANLAHQLQQIVQENTFQIVREDVPLSAIENQDWRGNDIVMHAFGCTEYGRSFELSADTYHGSADWRCRD